MALPTPEERNEIYKKTSKPLMWIAISSIVMLFVAFSSGYIVSKADSIWIKIKMPPEFLYSTVYILISSVTFFLAQLSIKKGKMALTKLFISFTLLLGIAFIYSQIQGYSSLNQKGIYFTDKVGRVIEKAQYNNDYTLLKDGVELHYKNGFFYDPLDTEFIKPITDIDFEKSNRAASWLFALSALHILHLIGGILSLIFVFIKTLRNKYSPQNYLGMQVSSIYWHFLDFLWLYLFAFLTFF